MLYEVEEVEHVRLLAPVHFKEDLFHFFSEFFVVVKFFFLVEGEVYEVLLELRVVAEKFFFVEKGGSV